MKEIYERQDDQNYLVYTLEEQDVLEMNSLQTMARAGGRLEGFVPTTFYQTDGTKFISYDIGQWVTLEKLLEKPLSLENCLRALDGLRQGMATVYANNLNPNTVPLDPYHVFSDPATGEARLLCVPLERQLPPNCNLKNLCLYLTHKAQPAAQEDGDGLTVLRERIGQLEFVTPHNLGQLLEELWQLLPTEEAPAEDIPGEEAPAEEAAVEEAPAEEAPLKVEEVSAPTPLPDPQLMPRLLRPGTGEEIRILPPEFHIGKSPRNDYVIRGNAGISRTHSVIVTRDEGIYVVDLNSTNGTYINGIRIPSMVETLLTHGAKLRLCNELFIVCLEL